MERFRDPKDKKNPFEQVREVGALASKDAAARLQEVLDMKQQPQRPEPRAPRAERAPQQQGAVPALPRGQVVVEKFPSPAKPPPADPNRPRRVISGKDILEAKQRGEKVDEL
jgi:hypothetical protein